MAAIKRIMTAVDFSETAHAAAIQAEELAKSLGAELIVVHVLDEPAFVLAEGSSYVSASVVEEYTTAMKVKLNGMAKSLEANGTKVTATLLHGAPHEAIVNAAESEKADLLVLGTHGRTGVKHMLLGSVAERVVRLSKVPVMTIRTP